MFKLNKLAVAVAFAAIFGVVSPATQASDLGVTQVFDDGSILQTFDDGSVAAFDSTGSVAASLSTDETTGLPIVSYVSLLPALDDGLAQMSQYVFDDGSTIQLFDDGSVIAFDTAGTLVASLGPDENEALAESSDPIIVSKVYNCIGATCALVAQYEQGVTDDASVG